jgi:uncharacterized protein (TIGR03545 family)
MSSENKENMKKQGMIRYSGIFAFVLVSALLLGCFYFVAPWLIKSTIESAGSKVVGAKVDVASIDLSLFPAGLAVNGLEVTDADNPMQNLFEVSRANASIDLLKLWMGQVIIEDLSIDAMRFSTARRYSGELAQEDSGAAEKNKPEDALLAEELDQLGNSLPDANELLSRQPLLTDKLKVELDQTYQKKKAEWEAVSGKLPDEKKFEYYQREFEALAEGDISSLEEFNKRKQKFDALKAELEQDKAVVMTAKEQLVESQAVVKQGIKDLRAAPQKDWEAIKAKYSFDESGALNMAGLLFGDEFSRYAETTLYWYRKLAPLMQSSDDGSESPQALIEPQRGQGRFVHFAQAQPSPDFLIKQAKANAVLSQGTISVVARDLTHQQYITQKPSTLEASGLDLKNPQAMNLSLSVDRRTKNSLDEFKLNVVKQSLDSMTLSDSESMPLSLQQAAMDLVFNLTLKGEAIEGNVKSNFTQAKLVGDGQSTLAKEVAAALSEVKSFSLDADLGGELSSPDIALSSDLDSMLKNAFSARLKKKQAEWEAKIKAGLEQRLNEYLANNEELGKYFSGQVSIVDTDINQIDDLLSTQLASFADEQQDKAVSEAESKLKGALKGLF